MGILDFFRRKPAKGVSELESRGEYTHGEPESTSTFAATDKRPFDTVAEALSAWQDGDPTRAERLFKQGIDEYSRHEPDGIAFALGRYGAFLLDQDRKDEAMRILERAIELKTDIPVIWSDYMRLLSERRDIDAFKRGIDLMAAAMKNRIQPEFALAHARRADREGASAFAEAIARWVIDRAVLDRDKEGRWAASGDLGRILENAGRLDEAVSLWQDAFKEGSRDPETAVQGRILKLRQRVLGLKDTRLYREIGGRQGRLQLRMTNVFSNDDVYRRIAELWQAWEAHIRSLNIDPDSRWRQEQDAAEGFERFVFLVIVRALHSLGYGPSSEGQAIPVNGTVAWTLDGPAGKIILRRDRSGISVASIHAKDPLKFVGLPAMLEGGVNVGEWIATVRQRSVVVVALPADEPRAPADVRVRLHRLSDGLRQGPMFIAAAPWDLESVERVARTVRWHAWAALYARYPVAVELPEGWVPPDPTPRWVRIAGRCLYVVRPPAAHERTWAALQARIDEAGSSLTDAKSKLDACDQRDRRKRLRLKHELDGAARGHEADGRVWANIEAALATVELLRLCPVCGTICDPHAFEHTDDLFRTQCSECGSAWGRRTCHACERPLPFLDFPGNSPSEDLLEADRRYGADVLAIPVAEHVYVCPNCESRTDGGPPCWKTQSSTAAM